jgi:hypothetical protein
MTDAEQPRVEPLRAILSRLTDTLQSVDNRLQQEIEAREQEWKQRQRKDRFQRRLNILVVMALILVIAAWRVDTVDRCENANLARVGQQLYTDNAVRRVGLFAELSQEEIDFLVNDIQSTAPAALDPRECEYVPGLANL